MQATTACQQPHVFATMSQTCLLPAVPTVATGDHLSATMYAQL